MLGERLNYIRKKNGYTARQMAELLNISLRSYRMYESGDRMPNPVVLCKIADTLDVSVDYLLERDDFLKSHGVSVDEH